MATQALYQTAITAHVDRDTMRSRVSELFEDLGFIEPPLVYDPEGEYLQAQIIGSDEAGHCLLIRETGESCLSLARTLAVLLKSRLRTFEVALTTEKDEADNDGTPPGPRVRALTVDPDGVVHDVPPEANVDDGIVCDDIRKTARRLLLELIDPEIAEHRNDPLRLWLYREPPQEEEEDEVEPRLRALLKDLSDVSEVTLTEISGQTALRFEQTDGTRRMSVVSDEDLEFIEAETGRSFR